MAIRNPCIHMMLGDHRSPHSPVPPNDNLWHQGTLDIGRKCAIIITDRARIRLRGAGCIRLRVDLVVLTREPDTANTVGGKDADMGVFFRPHCTWTACNVVNFIFGTPENTPFVIRTDLSFRHGSMKIPKYTKYSEISILCSESKSHAQIIKKVFSVLPVWRFPVCKTKPSA